MTDWIVELSCGHSFRSRENVKVSVYKCGYCDGELQNVLGCQMPHENAITEYTGTEDVKRERAALIEKQIEDFQIELREIQDQ